MRLKFKRKNIFGAAVALWIIVLGAFYILTKTQLPYFVKMAMIVIYNDMTIPKVAQNLIDRDGDSAKLNYSQFRDLLNDEIKAKEIRDVIFDCVYTHGAMHEALIVDFEDKSRPRRIVVIPRGANDLSEKLEETKIACYVADANRIWRGLARVILRDMLQNSLKLLSSPQGVFPVK